MPLYRHNSKIVLFVHIPKTGGSTIENTLKAMGVSQALHSRLRLGLKSVTPQHMHRDVIEKWIPDSFYDAAFCIVRNPYARISSEYKWQRQVRKANVAEFDKWVNNQFERHADNEFIGDNHIRPQSDFILNDITIFYLEEGLKRPVEFAMRNLGYNNYSFDHSSMRNDAKTTHILLEISENTLSNIKKFYLEDFERFGYDPEKYFEEFFILT